MTQLPFTPLRESPEFLNYFLPEIENFLGVDMREQSYLVVSNFKYTVNIESHEGSKITLHDAFFVLKQAEGNAQTLLRYDLVDDYDDSEDIFAVFTEHLGYFMFYKDTIRMIEMVENTNRIVFSC